VTIDILLFDVDGVLANGRSFSEHLACEHGITAESTAPFFRGRFLDCLVGRGDLRQELAAHLPGWGWPGTVEQFLDDWFTSEHVINELLMTAVRRYRARGIRCYIATNQEQYRTRYIREQMGFADAFDGLFASAEIGYMKHDPAFFAHLLHTLGPVPPSTVLFWDDSATNVATARSVGLCAKVYHGFAAFQQTMATYVPAR
jgi:putative hydrolase of the HAD superfamily